MFDCYLNFMNLIHLQVEGVRYVPLTSVEGQLKGR